MDQLRDELQASGFKETKIVEPGACEFCGEEGLRVPYISGEGVQFEVCQRCKDQNEELDKVFGSSTLEMGF